MSSDLPVRVRFAPSPTGAMHLGSALVAVANAAVARSRGGTFILRIDDTDQSRSRDEDAAEVLRLLRWLGIDWDEGPYRQSERDELYRAAYARLEQDGSAYPCFCGVARLRQLRADQQAAGQPPRYDGRCRALDPEQAAAAIADGAPHVLRFAVPDGRDVEFDDLVHGRMSIPAGSFGDPVLCRADGSPGYLLASVVDDIQLEVTHVVRGDDHLANTARQLLLFEALGVERIPGFAHLPLLRDADGRKLSKRDPLGTLDELSDEGFLPVSVRRYLAELLGQGSVDPLEPADGGRPAPFLFDRVPTGAPRVDRARLESLGREDMAKLDVPVLLDGTGVEATEANAPVVRELAAGVASRVAMRGELRLVFDGPGPGDLPHVLQVAAPDEDALARIDLAWSLAVDQLRAEPSLSPDSGVDTVWAVPFLARCRTEGTARQLTARDVLRSLRIALTGTTSGPGLDLVLTAIGAREALRRVQVARMVLEELVGGNHAVTG